MKTITRAARSVLLGTIILFCSTSCDGDAAGIDDEWRTLGRFVDDSERWLEPFRAAIAIDPTVDRPVVSVREREGSFGAIIRVHAWSGSAWEPLGGPTVGGTPAHASSLAVGDDGQIWLAWIEDDQRYRVSQNVFVVRWTGAAWESVGGNLAMYPGEGLDGGGNDARHPTIALDATGAPWVAWSESGAVGERLDVHVKRWDGAAWQSVGAASSITPADDEHASLVFGAERAVVVMESTDAGETSSRVLVKMLDNDAWVTFGELVGGERGYQRAPDAAFADNGVDLYVAYRGGQTGAYRALVERWDGAAWSSVGDIVDDGGAANVGVAAVAVDSAGRPVVAWDQQKNGQTAIYARRWSGTLWEPLGGALDGTRGNNFGPAIAIDATDAPIVVWDDGGSGQRRTIARRWEP